MKRVLIIGANSPLGRCLCAEFHRQGWYVIALVRNTSRAKSLSADQLVEARFADPVSLKGVMSGVTLVVSCLGIKHRSDAVEGWHIDYSTQLNLLREAERAAVEQFIYADQLHGLSSSHAMHVLRLASGAEPQTQQHQNQFETALAAKPAMRIHYLNSERTKL